MRQSTNAEAQRPDGWPVMHQTWDKLLFLHWSIAAEQLRPLIPSELEIETWDGTAWISITPLTIRGIRPPWIPPLPLLSQSHELNVRTYVRYEEQPGLWFLSLDASNPFVVWGARAGFYLPYFHASITMRSHGDQREFDTVRREKQKPARFAARWQLGESMPQLTPNTREAFLVERYCLYSARRGRIYRSCIHHRPWPLRHADVERLDSTVIASHGLPEPREPPLVQAQAKPLDVWIWPPRKIVG